MTVSNSLAKANSKPKFSVAIQSDAYKKLINNTLGNPKKAENFITAITSAVSVNPALQECDTSTIVSSALLGATLNLSPSPQLGQYYLVPFEDKKRGCKIANFILGYKGYLQLAIRSGQYKKINVLAIKEGELISFDPLNEEIKVNLIEDEDIREAAETIGYYAMFEYLNGFKKAIYWSQSKMEKHADKFSPAFSLNATSGKYPKASYEDFKAGKVKQSDMWLYSSFWYKDFEAMACKTLLRHILSKWGILSIEMEKAFAADMEAEGKYDVDYFTTDGEESEISNSPVDNFFDTSEAIDVNSQTVA